MNKKQEKDIHEEHQETQREKQNWFFDVLCSVRSVYYFPQNLEHLRVAKGVQSFRGFCFPCSLAPIWVRRR